MEWNKKYIVYVFLFFSIGFSIRYLLDLRYEKLMSDTKETVAIFKGTFISRNSGVNSIYSFSDKLGKSKLNVIFVYGSYDFLQKGDTVLIKYSKKDPSLAEIIDPCYMQKHKVKPYCK